LEEICDYTHLSIDWHNLSTVAVAEDEETEDESFFNQRSIEWHSCGTVALVEEDPDPDETEDLEEICDELQWSLDWEADENDSEDDGCSSVLSMEDSVNLALGVDLGAQMSSSDGERDVEPAYAMSLRAHPRYARPDNTDADMFVSSALKAAPELLDLLHISTVARAFWQYADPFQGLNAQQSQAQHRLSVVSHGLSQAVREACATFSESELVSEVIMRWQAYERQLAIEMSQFNRKQAAARPVINCLLMVPSEDVLEDVTCTEG